jgi:hypothetical protein
MTETITANAPETQSPAETTQQQPQFNPFADWSEQVPVVNSEAASETQQQQQQQAPAAESAAQAPTETIKVEEPIYNKEWFKNEFGVEDAAILKAEREEYKRLKEAPPTVAEIKFENDQSKHLHELIREGKTKEVREFLEIQERLDAISSTEVNKDTAGDIIKMGMKLKYKDLTPAEIDYKFNKQFSVPRAPVQATDELDEDFATRKAEWQEQVADIEMNKIIEAKLAKPELENAKTKISLPELSKPQAASQEPSQESLAKLEKIRENIWNALDSSFAKVEGFTTRVKDELVEYPVAFKIPDEAKTAIKERIKQGIDVNEIMEKRWFGENSTPKAEQMYLDLYVLENLDKILSGVANNAASERWQAHVKASKNSNINQPTAQQTFQQGNAGAQNVNPYSSDAWSEKPPVLQN